MTQLDGSALGDVGRLRAAILAGQVAVVVDDLRAGDLDHLGWSGSRLHLASVAEALTRVAKGEVDYLVARLPDGHPVAKAGIDYTAKEGSGTVWQVATHPGLEGLGLCRLLFAEAERRIAARGCPVARLGVEVGNDRARRLYRHLGYAKVGEEPQSWPTLDGDGQQVTYHTVCEVMEKRLRPQ